ncbi:NAD(+) kinase [Mortierella alpina]|nr:NAD(+) kinase [Mortierella alpina]
MEPDLDTCGMTNWVGSFDPIKFIYFMLATVLIPYPTYVFVATVFSWEHRAKRPARHYQDLLHATSYGVIVFIFGNYARTLNWITILAFWITWPCYSMIAELDFAKTSLPSWKTWPFGMYALFAGATAVVLTFAGYHIYLGVELNRTIPGFVGYYLLGLLIPAALTLIGYAFLKQQNKDLFGLSKVYNWMLHLQWKQTTSVTLRKAAKQKKLAAAQQRAQLTIDPPSSAEVGTAGESAPPPQAGTVLVQLDEHQAPSNYVSRTGSYDNLVVVEVRNNKRNSLSEAAVAPAEQRSALETAEPEITIQPYQPYVWSAAVPGHFHPHHWQLFYILAFFTRFDDWVSRVAAGITLGCYMQGIMDLQPKTIYDRFLKEFPDVLDPSPVLRWLDGDEDWIEIRPDDPDFEGIMSQVISKCGVVHIQSGDAIGVYEPTQLGTLMRRYEKVMDTFDHLSRAVVKLPPISNILIVTKPDPKLTRLTKDLSIWLLENFPGITIYVDRKLQDRSSFKYQEIIDQNPAWEDRLQFWTLECHKNSAKQIHLAVTLGGDGTVLYTAWMFQHRVPPIVAFHLGSLGFLTNFNFENYKPTMTNILRGDGMNLNIRMRLQCEVYKYKESLTSDQIAHSTQNGNQPRRSSIGGAFSSSESDDESNEASQQLESQKRAEILRSKVKEMDSKRGSEVADLEVCHDKGQKLVTRIPKPNPEEFMTPTDSWQVLNEVTVDRGSNAGMLQLELFVDGSPVTTILADGLVIATATGSTAYSVQLQRLLADITKLRFWLMMRIGARLTNVVIFVRITLC